MAEDPALTDLDVVLVENQGTFGHGRIYETVMPRTTEDLENAMDQWFGDKGADMAQPLDPVVPRFEP